MAEIRLVARHAEVYEPCEDSFALVDALLAESASLAELSPTTCMEIGCGSGYVLTSLARILNDTGLQKLFCLATDINPYAAIVSQQTFLSHGVEVDVIITSLASHLTSRLTGSIDILLFNPPYVPTPSDEVGKTGITSSWAGGYLGREVLNKLSPCVGTLLSRIGVFYLVVLAENNPKDIGSILGNQGFLSKVILTRRTDEETLHVMKFWRSIASM